METLSIRTNNVAHYQRKILNLLPYFGVTRQYLSENKNGTYSIKSSSTTAHLFFDIFIGNSLLKLLYILYVCVSQFLGLEFLDRIGVALYFLLFGIVGLSYKIWISRYPLFEILYQNWRVINGIYGRLGGNSEFRDKIEKSQHATVWTHLTISWIGTVCYLIQYYADPKYCTFTYALVEADNYWLFSLFGAHEFLFLLHSWNMMISCNSLLTFQSITFSSLITKMTKIVRENTILHKTLRISKIEYKVDELILDYKKLKLICDQQNQFLSYKTLFLHGCGYFQFVADVFLAVQVLRLTGTGVLDIWFFIEDSLASMYMIYRVYKHMSKVSPASEDFFRALKEYLCISTERKRLSKVVRTLRMAKIRVGPCTVVPLTVLNAMRELSSYYIVVALWK